MKYRLVEDPQHHKRDAVSVFANEALSFRAKGLLAYLFTLPAGASLDLKALASVSSEGRQAVQTAIMELERAGYCRPVRSNDPILDSNERMPQGDVVLPLFSERGSAPGGSAQSEDAQDMQVQQIIDRLNELRKQSWDWARYTPLSAKYAKNVEHINGRLGDGYAESDLLLVLEYLAAIDGGKEESRKYFDCVTPFNTKNFERNLTMAREWEARGRPQLQSASKRELEQSHDPSIYDRGRIGGQM
ncbi:hypothetical protein ACFLSZ_05180 [Candidatus Bipolaricaulota bacterium]